MAVQQGPQPMSREDRLALARRIADRALALYGDQVAAIGLYGSMARGTDGPFSDIEMFVVLRTPGEEFSHEWSRGAWKAEVDFYGADVLLHKAAQVEGRWPLTHGSYFAVLPLHDPSGFFTRLREAAESPSAEVFRAAICELLVGEICEVVGKWRNVEPLGTHAYLPALAAETAKYGAFLVGLHHRRTYTTGARVLAESLTLPNRPTGYDALCRMVMAGRLSDPAAVLAALEAFWAGVVSWAAARGYDFITATEIPF